MIVINSEKALADFTNEIGQLFEKHKYLSVKVDFKKRSIIQNSLQFHWYKELEQQGDQTGREYRNYCKYHFGCAIRAENDDYFATTMRDVLVRYPYEERLKMMDFIDVTSTFNSEQMKRYLTEIKKHFEPQGFKLTSSEDL